jgi:hypothetical protein
MFSFRTNAIIFFCITSTIAQAIPKNGTELSQKTTSIATVAAANEAFPSSEFTATLKRRNPQPPVPQNNPLTKCPASRNLLAIKKS